MKIPSVSPPVKVQVNKLNLTGETKLEIERRFLVNLLPLAFTKYHPEYIEQGYLATENGTSIRIRSKGCKYYQTVKTGSGKIREETEIEITKQLYDLFWKETKGRRIEKVRYEIPYEGKIIELDIYEGNLKGLVTVEVEFDSEEECDNFKPPSWFGTEVTGIKEFTNRHLAGHGIPEKLVKALNK